MRRLRGRRAIGATARAAALGSVVMLSVSIVATLRGSEPAAADGPQGAPVLVPEPVATSSDAFTLQPPVDARCEEDGSGSGGDPTPGPRTGADNWRWHTFIVEAGRDLSTLRFGPYGPGDDYDATDGAITAGLIASGDGVWQELPALKPEGLINPNVLGGLVLDAGSYALADGDYQLGFACTDDTLATRQWWSLTVTIRAAGSPFLAVAGGSATGAAPPAIELPADVVEAAALPVVPASAPAGIDTATDHAAVLAPAPAGAGAVSDVPVEISWAPLLAVSGVPGRLPIGGWAALAVIFVRIAYLIATPIRVLPPLAP